MIDIDIYNLLYNIVSCSYQKKFSVLTKIKIKQFPHELICFLNEKIVLNISYYPDITMRSHHIRGRKDIIRFIKSLPDKELIILKLQERLIQEL
jgi:hypothetical protein